MKNELKPIDLKLIQRMAHEVWQKYDDTYGYRTEKQERNAKVSTKHPDNIWFFWNQFDINNQKELVSKIVSEIPRHPKSVIRLIKWFGEREKEYKEMFNKRKKRKK